jgi:hypothetical protein
MNSRSRRTIALTLLFALHGIAILCGPAMHRHDRRAGLSRGSKATDPIPSERACPSHADCPVCHFLAQGQLGIDRVVIHRSPVAVGGAPLLEIREVPTQFARTSRPRAPPRA